MDARTRRVSFGHDHESPRQMSTNHGYETLKLRLNP